jgi:hypothetical protein
MITYVNSRTFTTIGILFKNYENKSIRPSTEYMYNRMCVVPFIPIMEEICRYKTRIDYIIDLFKGIANAGTNPYWEIMITAISRNRESFIYMSTRLSNYIKEIMNNPWYPTHLHKALHILCQLVLTFTLTCENRDIDKATSILIMPMSVSKKKGGYILRDVNNRVHNCLKLAGTKNTEGVMNPRTWHALQESVSNIYIRSQVSPINKNYASYIAYMKNLKKI